MTSRQKFPPAGRYGAQADTRGGSGLRREELRQRNFPRDAWTSDSRQQKRDSGSEQIRAEVVVCWNLRGTKSSGSGRSSGGEMRRWDPPSTGSTDLGCTINICKAALCVDITFGNSFAESPFSRFKLPLATCKSEKQADGGG